jgi:hypothetical protein
MRRRRLPRIRPGDLYEDCGLHVILCLGADLVRHDSTPWWRRLLTAADDWDLSGVSMYDLSRPRCCSARHCAPRKLTPAQALDMIRAHADQRQSRD